MAKFLDISGLKYFWNKVKPIRRSIDVPYLGGVWKSKLTTTTLMITNNANVGSEYNIDISAGSISLSCTPTDPLVGTYIDVYSNMNVAVSKIIDEITVSFIPMQWNWSAPGLRFTVTNTYREATDSIFPMCMVYFANKSLTKFSKRAGNFGYGFDIPTSGDTYVDFVPYYYGIVFYINDLYGMATSKTFEVFGTMEISAKSDGYEKYAVLDIPGVLANADSQIVTIEPFDSSKRLFDDCGVHIISRDTNVLHVGASKAPSENIKLYANIQNVK